MRFNKVLFSAAILLASRCTLSQVVDNGSETAIAAKAAAPDAKADQPAASSPEEQQSRALLELKAERTTIAGKAAPGDPQVAEIDQRIAALQQQIAGSYSGLLSDGAPDPVTAVPVYPRIVQSVSDSVPSAPAAGGTQATPSSFAAPDEMMNHSQADADASAAARRALQQTVTIAADHQRLADVIDTIAAQAHTNFQANWPALQTAGIDKNTPVSLLLTNVSAARALRAMLEQAGAGTANLGFAVDDGVVILSTRDDLSSSKYQTVRVYNVRDLLAVNPQYSLQAGAAIYEREANNLVDTLKSTVAPDSWRDNGGSVGSIRELDGLLIINQTEDNHIAVEQMLAKIRAADR